MPVYNPQVGFLRQAVASVQSQIYPDWELCIADDASPDPAVRDALREMAGADTRIKLVLRPENGHISAASNSALAVASGEFVALMDHDDILPDHALFEVAAALDANPDLDVIYSDEDHIDGDGRRNTPYFKSDFNPDLLLGHNLISHLGVYRRALLERIGGFRLGFEGSQDYDLALRAVDASAPERVHHIPAVLYHWRSATGTDTFSEASLQRCIAAARRAVADHLERRGHAGEVASHPALPNWQWVRRPRPDPAPLVSVIVPTKDRAELVRPCVDGLLNRTAYSNIEVLIVDHQSTEPSALALFAELARDPRVRVLPHEGPFNYSAINNAAVLQARGSVLALLNNDIDVIAPGWLDEMVALAVLPEVGAVGAKLLYPDDRVQHAGVILGAGGVAGHFFHRIAADDPSYFGRAALVSTVAAVTAACLVVRRAVFDEVGASTPRTCRWRSTMSTCASRSGRGATATCGRRTPACTTTNPCRAAATSKASGCDAFKARWSSCSTSGAATSKPTRSTTPTSTSPRPTSPWPSRPGGGSRGTRPRHKADHPSGGEQHHAAATKRRGRPQFGRTPVPRGRSVARKTISFAPT